MHAAQVGDPLGDDRGVFEVPAVAVKSSSSRPRWTSIGSRKPARSRGPARSSSGFHRARSAHSPAPPRRNRLGRDCAAQSRISSITHASPVNIRRARTWSRDHTAPRPACRGQIDPENGVIAAHEPPNPRPLVPPAITPREFPALNHNTLLGFARPEPEAHQRGDADDEPQTNHYPDLLGGRALLTRADVDRRRLS